MYALHLFSFLSCNSMPCSDCLALHGVNFNFKKMTLKKMKRTEKRLKDGIIAKEYNDTIKEYVKKGYVKVY